MIKRKYIIFQENIQKPIEVTDISDDDDDHVIQTIKKNFESDFINIIQTKKDIVFIRPNKINAILVSKIDDTSITHKNNSYNDSLQINDSNIEDK